MGQGKYCDSERVRGQYMLKYEKIFLQSLLNQSSTFPKNSQIREGVGGRVRVRLIMKNKKTSGELRYQFLDFANHQFASTGAPLNIFLTIGV